MFSRSPHKHLPGSLIEGTAVTLCAAALLLIPACSDDAPQQQRPAAAEEATQEPLFERKWLDVSEAAKPQVWLVSRATRSDVGADDRAVEPVTAMLEAAAQQFRESPRMIANRAVQLEEMLAETGITEPAIELIEMLSFVTPHEPKAESFGALCQHYFNLRLAKLGRDEALADLKRRYGTR